MYFKHLSWIVNCGLLVIGLSIGLLVCITLLPTTAHAEETPVTVPLAYIANFSNYGPTTATGTAQVWRSDAEVRLIVNGLPMLSTQKYACWLVDQQAGLFLPVGRFNVSNNGSAVVDVSLHGSLPTGYNMVLITIQAEPDPNPNTPSKLYSIAGNFQGNSPVATTVQHLPDTGVNAVHPTFSPLYKAPDQSTQPTSSDTSQHAWSYGLFAIGLICIAMLIIRNKRLKAVE